MPSPARLLDLTRLLSRLGKGQPTGIDRVEAAYLAQFLALPDPVFGLIRSKLGYLLLDRSGMAAFQSLLAPGSALPRADLISRLTRRNDTMLAQAETAVRKLALARCRPLGLPAMLRSHLPQGFAAFNTGHANLTAATLSALKSGGAACRAVLIHDTIPLDHPEFTRPDTIAAFARKLAATATHADLVIHSAATTRAQTEAHFARLGRIPPGVTAALGILPLHPAPVPPRDTPYFVTIGTIEPRKNHGFLLDLWEQMHRDMPAAQIPHLLILGRRGWSNAAVFDRLDSLPFINQTVFELPNLRDDQLAGLMAQSRGLLFPSFVEGYGLPPLEAASLGVAVILPPLPIYRETLGNYPVYASLDDSYSWLETIVRLKDGKTNGSQTGQGQGETGLHAATLPQWQAHFNIVLNSI